MLDSQKFIENYCQNKKNNTHCKGMCKLAEVSLENSTESSLKYDFTQLQMDFFLMESYNFLFIYNDFFEKNAFFTINILFGKILVLNFFNHLFNFIYKLNYSSNFL